MAVDAEVFIIGAGPAGLTAGYCLTASNRSVIIIEKDPKYVGGISKTVEYKGFLFDIGGHRFFSKSKEVTRLWKEILPNDFMERPRLSRIYYNRRFYSYPLNAFEALRNLGFIRSLTCVASFLLAKARPIKNPRSFHDWVRNQFGEELFSIFFKSYTEKVWGMSCEEISADWAAQRIKGLDLGVAIANALKRAFFSAGTSKHDPQVKTLIENFQYPRKGPGMMWEAAARKIKDRGGRILMGRALKSLKYDSDRRVWRVEVLSNDGFSENYTARDIVSSMAMREIAQAIIPSPASLKVAEKLHYRDFLIVALIVNKGTDIPDNWIYIHDPSVKVGRVQNFGSWSPEMVRPGMSCFGLEYFCFEGDGLWSASDIDLIALATKEIAQIGLINKEDVVDACVVRQSKAYPVYDDQYKTNIAIIRKELEDLYPTLHLVGRNGMHKYNNQDHAMMTAMLTTRNIRAGRKVYDVWNVNEDAEYHEAGASGVEEALESERLVPERAKHVGRLP